MKVGSLKILSRINFFPVKKCKINYFAKFISAPTWLRIRIFSEIHNLKTLPTG